MNTITTEQRYTDTHRTTPIEGWFNVHEGDRYIGTVHQWPDGRWCYGGRDQVADTREVAAEALVAYCNAVQCMPDIGDTAQVSTTGVPACVGTVEAIRERVFHGYTNIYVQVSCDPAWHHLDTVRTAL